MERNNIMLSFKGNITSDLLTSILAIMEQRLEVLDEPTKVKRKVYNVLVECLQNLYHHRDDMPIAEYTDASERAAIFMIGRDTSYYYIVTGNHLKCEDVPMLKQKIDGVNNLSRDELKELYKKTLNNGQMSNKGTAGLGFMDIARRSNEKLEYDFLDVDKKNSFFILKIKIAIN